MSLGRPPSEGSPPEPDAPKAAAKTRKARKPRKAAAAPAKERLVLEPAERREALLGVIGSAKRRLVLSLFRCDDFTVLDALANALERGCEVEAILTKRAKGGKKRLKKLCFALMINPRISARERSGPTISRRPSGRLDGNGTPAASALNNVSSPLTTDGSCVINTASHVFVKHFRVGLSVVITAVDSSATRYLAWYLTTGSA